MTEIDRAIMQWFREGEQYRRDITSMPLGCSWCGVEHRDHFRRFTDDYGWHAWQEPEREQIHRRLRALIGRRSPHLVEVPA